MRVLEIGCGPGAALREVARRVAPGGYVLGIDRSARAISQARVACAAEIAAGLVSLRCVAVEDVTLRPKEQPFHLAFALRVGALDGRHPDAGARALPRVAAMLVRGGKLLVGDGADLRAVPLRAARLK
ncbi:MAG: methyltransferase type 12 [Polyangiaceae bacterium]|nr:methyltransferase type 12 [Polyangiaceae bacterium]